MTEPAGIGENLSHPESTIPLDWLLDRNIPTTRSIIDSPNPDIWAYAQGVIAARYTRGIRTHLVWNSESAGIGAWPAPGSNPELLYLDRWRMFLDNVPRGAVLSATAGNEGSTPGWRDTEGQPITIETMARTAEAFADACAPYGVEPWATSIHTEPADAIALAQAVRGLCHGVPYHPYYRSLGGYPWPGWTYGTVEQVADELQEGYPDDVACCFDELGCPTLYDGITEAQQAAYCAALVGFQHPKIQRCWYFTGPRSAIPYGELADNKFWQVIGHPLAEAAFRNPSGGHEHVAAKYPEAALERYWHSIDLGIPFDIKPPPQGLGICRHWAEDPYKYGPPVAPEADEGNGNSIQLFAKMPIRWTPGGPEDVQP